MSLSDALSIASGGLANINRQLAVVSQNVSNAGTPGYAREVATQSSVTAAGDPLGVSIGLVTRSVDVQAQGLVLNQNAAVSGLQTRQAALQSIDALQGTPGQGNDLPSLVGTLENAFSTLLSDPSNQAQQSQVVQAAHGVAAQVNALSAGIGNARQAAQDGLVTGVAALNAGLAQIGTLSDQIVRLQSGGRSTADLENQRDVAMMAVSQLVDVKFLAQSNGDMLAVTSSGLQLPLHADRPPFATSGATLAATTSYPGGGIPAITLHGVDVTGQLSGGQLGASITLRDKTLPTYQGALDEFAEGLSNRFAQQGLILFSDSTGTVPVIGGPPAQSGYVGYAGTMQVNPAVTAAPSLVRDGTTSIGGNPSGASAFSLNPAGGPVGFTTLIDRVLSFTFGAEAQPGVGQLAMQTSGLGPAGTLSAPFVAPTTLEAFAAATVAAQASDSADATSDLKSQQAVQTALKTQAAVGSTVSIDQEMSNMVQLQNSYGANAKVMTAVQSMWSQLLAAVP